MKGLKVILLGISLILFGIVLSAIYFSGLTATFAVALVGIIVVAIGLFIKN